MSLKRPTVARLLFTYNISPFCDVAQTSDCGISVIYFHYKPFPRCRIDVRLWHALSFTFQYKPFMWCCSDARLWHYYSCIFRSRSHSDPRLAPVLLFYSHASCLHLLYLMSKTVLRVHSKYSPGLLIWPDVDEGDLMDEEYDRESDA